MLFECMRMLRETEVLLERNRILAQQWVISQPGRKSTRSELPEFAPPRARKPVLAGPRMAFQYHG